MEEAELERWRCGRCGQVNVLARVKDGERTDAIELRCPSCLMLERHALDGTPGQLRRVMSLAEWETRRIGSR